MLLTLNEAAAFLRCSIYTVRRRIRAGEITPSRVGPRSTRISQDELAAYVRRVSGPPAQNSAAPAATASHA